MVSLPREERKVVTVLFADLVDFVVTGDQSDPEDLRALLAPYHARARGALEAFGGTVEKFIGDAVVGVFGAPAAREDDAERAVLAGLRVLQAIDELKEAQSRPELAVRIAVATGEAVVALEAQVKKGETIVTGDVVNTASRLQHAAPPGGLVVDELTYRRTHAVFDYEQLEPASVKGKPAAVPIWRAHGARRDAVETRPALFVGRAHELALLRGTYERVLRERAVQLVTLTGEPGIGKSRLLAELRSTLEPDRVWRQGRCLHYGEGITFWALGEIVKAQAGILESDAPTEAASKLALAVSAIVPEGSERDWVAARLAPLVGAAGPDAGGSERTEAFTAWRRFLEALAASTPLVLVIEDLHWADAALLDFIEHLIDWAADVPLLILCTARPELYERAPGWGGGKRNSTTIALSPLNEDETGELISTLLTDAQLPTETEAALLERAAGNPLYAEEFVRMVGDRSLLQGKEEIPVPENLQALIAARLDTLPAERKAVLHDAAVVGKVFWAGAVAAVGGRDGDVQQELHELARKELVRRARESSVEGDTEYAFWHILVRDVAYRQIPRIERARKHRATAAWLERIAGERVTDHAELLAYHYEQALELARAAGTPDEVERLAAPAARFLLLAGERALPLDVAKAETYYRRALELLGSEDEQRPRALARLAEAVWLTGRYEEAIHLYEQAIAGLQAAGDRRGAGETLVKFATVLRDRGETARAPALLEEAVKVLEPEGPGPELVLAYTHVARDHMFAGRAAECFEWAEKAMALARELGMEERAMRALQCRGFARWERGDRAGLDDLRKALRIGLEIGLGDDTAAAYINLGDIVWWAEGPAAGLDVYRAGIDFADRRGLTFRGFWLRAESVWPLFELGRWDELLEVAREVVEWDREHGPTQVAMLARPYEAHVRLLRGEVDAAAVLADEFVDRARAMKDPQVLDPALVVAACIEQARDNAPAALSLIRELEKATWARPLYRAMYCADPVRVSVALGALDLGESFVEGTEAPGPRQSNAVLTAQAVLAEARGDTADAERLYEEAAYRWQEYGFLYERALALLGLARLGRQECIAEAKEILSRLGAADPLP